ncbi:reverse transcriptase [Senna tora]|uniref:Reverse transcriptase n=1 Tax=Senna tora TaxID=362788 RepID=A0A834STE7_9FABA|nr:reverse transcriptase [Senna tora]
MQPRTQVYVTVANHLGRYLGTNIDLHQNKTEVYKVIVDKKQRKLAGWKSKLLSQSAILVLINSMIQASPIYQLADFNLPKRYSSHIDVISTNFTNFFWGFKGDKPPMHLPQQEKNFFTKGAGSTWTSTKYFKGNLERDPVNTSQPFWAWRV